MLSKDLETLAAILKMVGKNVNPKMLKKHSTFELTEAEKWAVLFWAKEQGLTQKEAHQPDWLRTL